MIRMNKALRAFIEEARESDSYWVESAKLQFALALEKQRGAIGLAYKAVAEKLGTSAAYVTKVFRGDANLTIESMVKLARATGGQLEIRVVPAAAASMDFQWSPASFAGKKTLISTPSTATEFTPANDARFALAA